MSLSKVWIVAGLVVVLAVFVALNLDRTRYDPTASYQDKLAYWKTRIHAVGGQRAYEEMALAQTGFVHGMQHNETHIFGSALYSEEGIEGVAVCDERFEYACFHQLIAEALSNQGVGSLNEIIEACRGGPGCKHSIGHGVLGLVGYTFADLQKAVSICATLPNDVYVQGCYGGAIMEYHMQTLLADARRVGTMGKNWFEPCDQLPATTARVCYFWQPTWWRSELQSADQSLSPSALDRMGTQCRTVSDTNLSAACFEGIGVSALNAGRTTADGVTACSFVSTDTHDQALCRTSVARLVRLLQGLEEGRSVCLGLSETYQASCLRVIERASPEESYLGEALPFEK